MNKILKLYQSIFFKKKPAEYTRTTSGTIFRADIWISGGQVIFHYKTWYIPLEAFAY